MKYRPELDGLRAIAVLAVIFSHVGIEAFAGGFIGVDVFFVISGYLITSIILRDLDAGTFSLATFYERRAKRILPALFFVLLCSFALFWTILEPAAFKRFSNSLIAASLSVSNFYFLNSVDYFAPAASETPLLHTWSLAIEEQFYLIFPLLLLGIASRNLRIASITSIFLISLCLCLLGAKTFPTESYYLLPTRAWELLAGALLAFYPRSIHACGRPLIAMFGLGLIILSIFWLDEAVIYPSAYTVLPVIGAMLFISCASNTGVFGSLMANPVAVWLGKLSFSAYLWHQVVFVYWRVAGYEFDSYSVKLLLVLFVFLCALATYFLIERPLRYIQLRSTLVVRAFVVVVSISISLGAWGAIGKGLPFRMSDEYARLQSELKWSRNCLVAVETSQFELPSSDCVLGPEGADLKVALWGDSVSAAMAPTIMRLFPQDDVQFTQLFYSACAPIHGVYSAGRDLTRYCGDVTDRAFEYILAQDFDAVILGAAWVEFFDATSHFIDRVEVSDKREALQAIRAKFERTIDRLLADGKTVILLDPVMMVDFQPAARMFQRIMAGNSLANLTISQHHFESNTALAREGLSISPRPGLYRVDPRDAFCRGDCYLGENGVIYFADPVHFTEAGARLVGEVIRPALVAAGLIR